MLKSFKAYIKKYQLFRKDQKLLVAVSGGIDSMVLCHLLERCGYTFAMAHCDFQLRGEASKADADFVNAMAQKMNTPYFETQFNTAQYAKKNKMGIQEAARTLRYAFFYDILKTRKIEVLLTAHHANDNIETVLHHFMRGSGWQGLSGMANRDEELIRPLLWATKKEITAYATFNKIDFREDLSNATAQYTRNALRLHVIPEMEKINPNFVTASIKTIEYLRDSYALFSAFIESLRMDYVTLLTEDSVQINTSFLPHFPSPHIILYEFLKRFDFNATQVENITDACFENNTASKLFFTKDFEAEIKNKFITVRKKLDHSEQHSGKEIFNFENKIIFQNHEIIFEEVIGNRKIPRKREKGNLDTDNKRVDLNEWNLNEWNLKNQSDAKTIYIDLEKAIFPLTLRHIKTGDTFFPFGLDGKPKKISAMLKPLKLSAFEKEKQTVLVNGNGDIIWLLGVRADARYSVTEITNRIVKISCND